MPVSRVNGWTVVTPSADSRIVYIAAESSGGNDASAAAVYGRGYYLPSDPEIGPDPTQPVGTVVAYRNPQEVMKVLRGTGPNHVNGGNPEWILFRRGDSFPNSIMDANYTYWGKLEPTFDGMGIWVWAWTGTSFSYEAGQFWGRSDTEPFVISAWGPVSEARPVFPNGFAARIPNSVVSSLDVQSRAGLQYLATRNLILEDCRSQGHGMIAINGGGSNASVTLRRCVFADGWNSGGHNSSPFNGTVEGTKITIEECVFDKNGYKENPADATQWTATYISSLSRGGEDGNAELGTGVQPTRTWFDRNWYMSGNAGNTLILRGNIAARTGGGAEQMRSGGLAYRNVFLMNHDGLLMGSNDVNSYGNHANFVVQNLFLHDDVFLPPGGWGMNNHAQGADTVIAENIYAHPNFRGQNGPGTFFLWNMKENEIVKRIMIGNVLRAKGRFKGFATQRSLGSLTHPTITIKNNQFSIDNPILFGYGAISREVKSDLDTIDDNYYFGNPTSDLFTIGYGSGPASITKTNRSFQTWQSAGYDQNGQIINDWNTFKNTVGWTYPDRDIVSYMQTIDPNYVPNENVRVDYGTKVQQKVPKLVKDFIPQSGFAGIPNEHDRITVAKRFHAAITFLLRARENRKGKWSNNYTAEALNNYIREGFGKPLVGGEYVLTLDDAFDIIENEIPTPTEPPVTPEPEPVTPEPEPVEPTQPEENNMENDFVSLQVLNNTSINKVTTKTESGVCLVDLYNNDVLVTKIETSSTDEYVFIKVKNQSSVGETIEFTLSPNNQNKTIKFTSYF